MEIVHKLDTLVCVLQWGPVVVTGIRRSSCGSVCCTGFASMGSGRGDRNQLLIAVTKMIGTEASMGSGRGDRNQGSRLT